MFQEAAAEEEKVSEPTLDSFVRGIQKVSVRDRTESAGRGVELKAVRQVGRAELRMHL